MTEHRWERVEACAFALACAVLLLPLAVFFLLPTQDGPVHLYNAELIRQHLSGQGDWFSAWIVPNPRFDPTWPPHLILVAMLSVLPPDLSECLYQAGCILALPIALRYALRSFAPDAVHWCWLGLPFAYSFTFHMGFYSFCYGVGTALWMLGYWWRCQGRWNPRRVLVMGLIAVLAFYTHVYPMLVAGFLMVPLALTRLAGDLRQQGLAAVMRRSVLPQLIAFGPALLLVAEFLINRQTEVIESRPFGVRLAHLGSISYLLSYTNREVIGTGVLGLVLGLCGLYALRRPGRPRDALYWGLFAGVLAVLALLFALDETMIVSDNGMRGGGYMIRRTQPVLWMGVIIWCAVSLPSPRWRLPAVLGGIALTLLGIGLRAPTQWELQRQLEEYDFAAAYIGRHELVLALNAYRGGLGPAHGPLSIYADPFRHRVNRLAMQREAFSINNYEAVMGYFPLMYTEAANPWANLGALEDEPPVLFDLPAYEAGIGHRIDVILLWGGERRDVSTALLRRQLSQAGFERIAVSPGLGLMEVFRRPLRPPVETIQRRAAGSAGSASMP